MKRSNTLYIERFLGMIALLGVILIGLLMIIYESSGDMILSVSSWWYMILGLFGIFLYTLYNLIFRK